MLLAMQDFAADCAVKKRRNMPNPDRHSMQQCRDGRLSQSLPGPLQGARHGGVDVHAAAGDAEMVAEPGDAGATAAAACP